MLKKRFFFLALIFSLGLGAACEGETFVRQEPSKLLVNTDLVDFGPVAVGTSLERTLSFTAHGIKKVEVTELTFDPAASAFSAAETVLTIEGNTDRKVSIFFAPTLVGEHEASLNIESDAINVDDLAVVVKGVAYEEIICGDCNSPPVSECITATTRLIYNHVGECVEGQCQYQSELEECEYGCHEPSGTCNGEPLECEEDSDCDDGVFCNGSEVCNANNCEPGLPPCTEDLAFCDEELDACVDCTENIHCTDGLYCNGEELCTAGVCGPGSAPCWGTTPICDEETQTCSGCDAQDPCSSACLSECEGHCRCLNAGNNLVSAPFIYPDADNSLDTLFDDARFVRIIGGKSKAERNETTGTWSGSMTNIGAEEGFWLVPSEKMLWSMPGIPDFDREYHLFRDVEGLLNDCSEEGETCDGMTCTGDNGYQWTCDSHTNWISFAGLATQRIFDGDGVTGVIPPEAAEKIEMIVGEGVATFKDVYTSDEDGSNMVCSANADCLEGWHCSSGLCSRWIGSLTSFAPMRGYQVMVSEDVSFQFRIDTSLSANAPYATE